MSSDIIVPSGMSAEQLDNAMKFGGRVEIPVQIPQKLIDAKKEMIHEGQLILEALKSKAGKYEKEEDTDNEEYIKLRALMWMVKLNLPPEVV